MRAALSTSMMALALAAAACGGSSTSRTDSNSAPRATDTRPATRATREVELPSGVVVAVRVDRALSTVRNRAGDPFGAILDAPVMADGTRSRSEGPG
jgi:hypothetical protein